MNKPPQQEPRPPLVGIITQHDIHGLDYRYPKADIARDANGVEWVRTWHSAKLSGTVYLEVHDGRLRQPPSEYRVSWRIPSGSGYDHVCVPVGMPAELYG